MALNFETRIRIQASPAAFFASFSNPSRWQGQMTGAVTVELLTPGDFGVGTRWRETRRMYGRPASEVFAVTAWAPPDMLELYVDGTQGSTGQGGFRYRYTVTPEDDAILVNLAGEMLFTRWYARLLGRLMLGTFRRICDRDLASLKAFLEQDG